MRFYVLNIAYNDDAGSSFYMCGSTSKMDLLDFLMAYEMDECTFNLDTYGNVRMEGVPLRTLTTRSDILDLIDEDHNYHNHDDGEDDDEVDEDGD